MVDPTQNSEQKKDKMRYSTTIRDIIIGILLIVVSWGVLEYIYVSPVNQVYEQYSQNTMVEKSKRYLRSLKLDSATNAKIDSAIPANTLKFQNDSLRMRLDISVARDRVDLMTKILTALFVIAGLYLNFRRTRALDRQNKNAESQFAELKVKNQLDNENSRKQLDAIRQKNQKDEEKDRKNLILQQYSKASELFAKEDNITARLSGIYLFEKIMNESKDYHWRIVELYTAYLKEKRSHDLFRIDFDTFDKKELLDRSNKYRMVRTESEEDKTNIEFYRAVPVEKDIQAIITVLGKRNLELEINPETGKNLKVLIEELVAAIKAKSDRKSIKDELSKIPRLDLAKLNLYKANLRELDFSYADCELVYCEDTDCSSAHFEGADCSSAYFEGAYCGEAHFEGAICIEAHFEGAYCLLAHFEGAICIKAHFEGAICIKAHFEGADCLSAHFEGANCLEAHFEGADCLSAHFENTIGLTAEQLCRAKSLYDTIGLSDEMKKDIEKLNDTIFKEPYEDA